MKKIVCVGAAIIGIVVCYMFYYVGEINGTKKLFKIKSELRNLLDNEENINEVTIDELLEQAKSLKEKYTVKTIEYEKLKKKQEELVKKIAEMEIFAKQIVGKLKGLDLDKIVVKDEKGVAEKSVRDIVGELFGYVKNGDYKRALEQLVIFFDLLAKANHDYITILR
ncbi:MAG: hypothetical protein ACK4NF_00320 [Planctomycetota bacterium]